MPTIAAAIGLPFDEAIDFFKQKTRIPSSHWTDVWRTAHTRGFMVAGATSDALLSDFQDAATKALTHGTTLEEFRKDFDAIVAKHGWQYKGSRDWRSQLIYETNLRSAQAAGTYAQLTEPETLAAFPYWQYIRTSSEKPNPAHLVWVGTVLRADDPFWHSHFPPNGWKCKCSVRPVSGRDLARMGKSGPDQAPPIATREWRNPKTGELHHVPIGIDPGWDYNVGEEWLNGGRAIPVRAPDLVQVLQEGSVEPASPARIKAFVESPEGSIPIGRLSEQAQEALGSETDMVMLSADTMEKQLGRRGGNLGHAELTPEEYQLLPTIIALPDAVLRSDENNVLLLSLMDRVYAAVIKATRDRKENYLQSFHRIDQSNVRRRQRNSKLLLGSFARLLDPKKDEEK